MSDHCKRNYREIQMGKGTVHSSGSYFLFWRACPALFIYQTYFLANNIGQDLMHGFTLS